MVDRHAARVHHGLHRRAGAALTRPDLKRPFRVRAPWIVCIGGALVCSAMMLSLPRDTWLRLGVWTAIGFLIYVLYGFRNSALRRSGH